MHRTLFKNFDMKAPDKIYLCEDAPRAYDWQITPFKKGGSIEYIRKDALLKWLEGKMTVEGATEGIVGGYDFALKDVINHIKSL